MSVSKFTSVEAFTWILEIQQKNFHSEYSISFILNGTTDFDKSTKFDSTFYGKSLSSPSHINLELSRVFLLPIFSGMQSDFINVPEGKRNFRSSTLILCYFSWSDVHSVQDLQEFWYAKYFSLEGSGTKKWEEKKGKRKRKKQKKKKAKERREKKKEKTEKRKKKNRKKTKKKIKKTPSNRK